jgi:hypothetical protein
MNSGLASATSPLSGDAAHPEARAAAVGAPSRTQLRSSLVWSEYLYLLCIAIALALVIVPPDWTFAGRRIVRQLPLIATIPIALLCFLGRKLSERTQPLHAVRVAVSTLLPLGILSIWIVTGSLYARNVEHLQATFLNLGLYMTAAIAAAVIVASSAAPTRLARAYLRLVVIAAIAMTVVLALSFGQREIYHEQIFLVIPIAIVCAISPRSRGYVWLACAFVLTVALLSRKNTSYLIAVFTVLYIAVFLWLNTIERAPSIKQLWAHYLAFIAVLFVAAAGCFLIYYREHYLPSGNVEFRSFTYRAAWQQFLESPVWGSAFTSESIRKFTLYTVGIARNRLPTHSDVMDLLANGGLIAITLWLWSYVRAGVFSFRRVLAPRYLHYPWAAHAHAFAMISLAAVTVYAFNPILLQPEMAFLTWTTLGFLVGLAASCDPERHAGDIARRFHAQTSGVRP